MEAQSKIREALIIEEGRKMKELKQKKSEKEYWKYIKGEDEYEIETEGNRTLRIEGVLNTEEEKNKIYIKKYWEGIGRKEERQSERETKSKVRIKNKELNREQNYEITKGEIHSYLKKLKNMKAVGPDGLPNEFYKEGGEKIQNGLYSLFKAVEEEKEVPIEWNEVNKKINI